MADSATARSGLGLGRAVPRSGALRTMIGVPWRMVIMANDMSTAFRAWPRWLLLLLGVLRDHPELEEQLRKFLGAARRHPGTPPDSPLFTPTELRILVRIANTDDKFSAIWSELHMSKRSFEMHLDRIYTKLGTRKRSGLVREAICRGLV